MSPGLQGILGNFASPHLSIQPFVLQTNYCLDTSASRACTNEKKRPIRKRICVMSQVPVFMSSLHQSKYAKSVHWAYMYFFHYKFYHNVGKKCVIFYPGLLVFIIDLFVLLTSNFAFRASSVNVVCTMCSIMLILQSNTMKERTKIGMELA